MPSSKVQSVALPAETALRSWMADAQLVDAYAIALPAAATSDPAALAAAVLDSRPPGSGAIMAVRDALVRPFGIKSAGEIAQAGRAVGRPSIGFFPMIERGAAEVILGADDRHLDFRISFLVREAKGQRDLVWISVVRCHGLLGRAYLAAVRPFHPIAIRRCLVTASRRGWPADPGPATGQALGVAAQGKSYPQP